jgi:hypothetical protein
MSQPPYDYSTIKHIVETKFVSNSENPLQISRRNPHHPQYSLKNKRYECGCGFKGDKLDYQIMSKSEIPTRKHKSKRGELPNHYDRFTPVMVGADIIMIKKELIKPYIPQPRVDTS